MANKRKYYKFPARKAKLKFVEQYDDILYYTVVYDAKFHGTTIENMSRLMGVSWSREYDEIPSEKKQRAIELYSEIHDNLYFLYPRDMFWNAVNGDEIGLWGDYDYLLFRAFQAVKSIQGERNYCKMGDKLLVARMSGYHGIKDYEAGEKLAEVEQYNTRRKLERIKLDLEVRYNVRFLAPAHCRGYYVTTRNDITLEYIAKDIVRLKREKDEKAEQRAKDKATALSILEANL